MDFAQQEKVKNQPQCPFVAMTFAANASGTFPGSPIVLKFDFEFFKDNHTDSLEATESCSTKGNADSHQKKAAVLRRWFF